MDAKVIAANVKPFDSECITRNVAIVHVGMCGWSSRPHAGATRLPPPGRSGSNAIVPRSGPALETH